MTTIYTKPISVYNDAGGGYEYDGERIIIKHNEKEMTIGSISTFGNLTEKMVIIGKINELLKELNP